MYVIINTFVLIIYVLTFGVRGNNENLIAVVQIFRHGQRTPFEFSPKDRYSDLSWWTAEPGQLVNEGKVQQYELGKFTKERYTGFLPPIYTSENIYVQTTDEDRTHMSAQVNLAGLYPPVSKDVWNKDLLWQPIPVHVAENNILWLECDALYLLLESELTSSEPLMKLNKEYSHLFDYLSNHTGTKIRSLFSAFRVYDTMLIETLSNLTLPNWAYAVYPEPLRTIATNALEAHCHTDTLKKVCVGRLLKDILDHFNVMLADSSRSYKLKIYSSHDKNVACILNALGAFVPHIPGFASSVYIELRRDNKEGYVNIWYKNSSSFQPITVKGCSFNCTLSQFKQLVGKYAVDAKEYNRICAIKKEDLFKKQIDPLEVWGGYTHMPPHK